MSRPLRNLQRRRLVQAASAAALMPAALGARAQEGFPSKPVRIINGSPPGSTFDAIGRAAGTEAEKVLKQPIIMEYRSGAGGTPAFQATKSAAPDGYTLGILSLSTVRQPLLENVGFDALKDFTWIASLAEINFGVVVPADSPFKTWADLLAWGRANPSKVNYGCPSGLGNSAHIFVAEIATREKLDWVAVPFRASNDCMVALLGGQLTFSVDTLISAAPQERAGKVRLLAMATNTRIKAWPDVPTMKELGYPFSIESPVGIGGPAGMDSKVVETLQNAFKFASEQPSFQALLDKSSSRTWYMDSAEFRRFAERSDREQREVLTRLGLGRKPG